MVKSFYKVQPRKNIKHKVNHGGMLYRIKSPENKIPILMAGHHDHHHAEYIMSQKT